MDRNWMKTGEAAQVLGVSRDTVRRYLADGHLTGQVLPSGHARIDRESVEALAEAEASA